MSRPPNKVVQPGKTLLERAKNCPKIIGHQFSPDDQEVELLIAWANGEIQTTQAAMALGKKANGTFWQKMGSIFRAAVLHGMIKVERTKR